MRPLFGPRLAIAVALLGLLVGAQKAVASLWSIRPLHSGAPNTILFGVSCQQVRWCLTVGDSVPPSDPRSTAVVARWDGTRFRVLTPPEGPGGTGDLTAVSCPTSAFCQAAGQATDGGPLAESWNFNDGAVQSTPSGDEQLTSVSCPAAAACTAVAEPFSRTDWTALRWNGHTWSAQSTPVEGELAGVSCPFLRWCIAVGEHGVRRHGFFIASALAERWDGKGWSVMRMPSPRGADQIYLKGISCASRGSCTAVGYYTSRSHRHRFSFERPHGLAEHWNGHRWRIQALASAGTGRYSELFGVSCPLADTCTAVGNYTTGHHRRWTLAERWNGRRWSLQRTPNLRGAFKSLLLGVSCPSTLVCMAVGYSAEGTPQSQTHIPLVERWY